MAFTVKWFCHISEFGGERGSTPFVAASVLPVMLFLSDRLTLWSPSGLQFRDAQKNGKSILGPEGLLDLVRKKRIQILGREKWLTSPQARESSDWPYAPWDQDFDLPIAEMALDDRNLPLPDRRVVLVEEEDGWKWADKQLQSLTEKVVTTRRLLAKGELPPGFIEKADRYGDSVNGEEKEKFQAVAKSTDIPLSEWLRIRSVLRDARNHEKAFKLADCHLSVEPSDHPEAIPTIMGRRAHQADENFHLPPNDQLWEFLQLAASLSRPRNADDLEKLLERSDRADLVREMTPFMINPYAALELDRRLQENLPPSWSSVLNPFSGRTPVINGFKLFGYLGLLSAFVGMKLNPEAIIGLVISFIGCGRDIGEKVNLLRVSDYTGPKFPVVLGYDHREPKYKELLELRQQVQNHLLK